MAVKPGQRILSTGQKRLTGARLFCLALGLGQQLVKCWLSWLRGGSGLCRGCMCVCVERISLLQQHYFDRCCNVDIKNVLFTNVILLSSELCAARIYSNFISISVASQVLDTQDPITRIPVSLDIYRQLLQKMTCLILLIAKLYNAGSCSVVHCWIHFF